MTRTKQRELLRAIMRDHTKALLAKSHEWPDGWDGHELRELVAATAEQQRTRLMREDRRRRRECAAVILERRLA